METIFEDPINLIFTTFMDRILVKFDNILINNENYEGIELNEDYYIDVIEIKMNLQNMSSMNENLIDALIEIFFNVLSNDTVQF
jgi:hypothetical protein